MTKSLSYLGTCILLAATVVGCGDDAGGGSNTDDALDAGGTDEPVRDDSTDDGTDTDGGNTPTTDLDAGGSDDGGALPITLSNPIHVVPDSDADAVDGSEEHPFATLYDAASAILADPEWDGLIVVHAGVHELPETVTIPRTADLEFEAGATLALGYKANFNAQRDVKVLGEEDLPVTFTWLVEKQHWGTFNLFEPESQENVFQYAVFAHGGEGQFKGIGVRGALSLENASALITDCLFLENEGDDALSLGRSESIVMNNRFIGNFLDAIDVDGPAAAEIFDNYFESTGNDAIDCGEGATFLAHDNVIVGSGDKGISVGEGSTPILVNNVISDCFIGIGVKDGSDPDMSNNTVYGSDYGFASYESVADQGTGKGTFRNGIIWNSGVADVALVGGGADFSYSCIQSGGYVTEVALEGEEPVGGDDAGVADAGRADGAAADSGVTASGLVKFTGEGMVSAGAGCDDPLFANPDEHDFHLSSTAGRYVETDDEWVQDDVDSPCLDMGDPGTATGDEPEPNGGRVNLGGYGGTEHASRSSN